jgi:tetratricopeptide (TPR) repeat protein
MMMTPRLLPGFLAVLLAAPAAFAQADDAALRAERLQKAQAFVNQASQLYLQGNYEAALGALQQAAPLAEAAADPGLPGIRFNIARCLEQLQRWPEALDAYGAYNKLPDEPHRKERAWEAVRGLKRKVYGQLAVTCFPQGAQVRVEGPDMHTDAAPCPYRNEEARPGDYTVIVTYPGYLEARRSAAVTVGSGANLEVSLARDPAAAPPPLAVLGPQSPPERPMNVWPWVAVGAGAAAAGVGVYFTTAALSARDDAESEPPGEAQDEAVSRFERDRTLSYAMYGAGGALAAVGVALYFLLDDDDEDGAAAQVVPSASGLTVRF